MQLNVEFQTATLRWAYDITMRTCPLVCHAL